MIVEVCANSFQSALNAQDAGADRIELCSELAVGGITPNYGLLKKVTSDLKIPVHVLIRPRRGNFVYTPEEVKTTATQIEIAKSLGADGIVMGALNEDHSLPLTTLKNWVKMAHPLDLTFHRAFDRILQPKESLKLSLIHI